MNMNILPDEIWHRIFTEANQGEEGNATMLSSLLACRKFAVRGRLRYS
jgi:hypothetical protein